MKLLLAAFYVLCCLTNLRAQENCVINDSLVLKDAVKRNLQFLGSDLFEGRGTGTTGGDLAAKYLALEFAKLQLIPAGSSGTYYQHVQMHGSRALPSSKLTVFSSDEERQLKLNDDYLLYSSGEQTFLPLPLELIFVGYGITAPEFDYNDYYEINVEGKIVVFLDGEPESDDPGFFDGSNPTIYSHPEAKQRIAVSRGASGSILIPSGSGSDWSSYISKMSFEDIKLAYSTSGSLSLLINPASADVLFKDSGYDLESVYSMQRENKLKSFPLSTSVSFKGEFKERNFISPNIAGILEGTDAELKNSYIIVSAHYDHLGIGPAVNGDSIYNGVFDNAIGSAALIETARLLKQYTDNKRSILFLLTTGEENGLLGSSYYTANPLVPLSSTIANVNIDGIALFKGFESIIGIGAEFSTLHDYLAETAELNDLTVTNIPSQFSSMEAFNRSDQIAFAHAGIPSILILDGPDNKYLPRDSVIAAMIEYSDKLYHSPFDDLNQNIDYDAAAEHITVLYTFICLLAGSEVEPEWNSGVIYNQTRLRNKAERR